MDLCCWSTRDHTLAWGGGRGARSAAQRLGHHGRRGLHRDRTLPLGVGSAQPGRGPWQNQVTGSVPALLTHDRLGLSSELGHLGQPASSPHAERDSREVCHVASDQLKFPSIAFSPSLPYHEHQLKKRGSGFFFLVSHV